VVSKSHFILLSCAVVAVGLAEIEIQNGQWPFAGQNLSNTRSPAGEFGVNTQNVGKLKPKWVFTTGGDVSATPTVAGDAVYFPDWAGTLFPVEKDSGKLIWSHKISEYDGRATAMSRVSPAVSNNELIFGDNLLGKAVTHDGANVIAVDRKTGLRRWITKVDTHPAAIITGSPVVFGDMVFVGVSSNEEALATDPNYPCCTFRGSMVALNVNTGAIVWKTYVVPDNSGKTGGYSGNAIWQIPAVDPVRNSLFFGTGNNYTVPASVLACGEANPNGNCTAPDDHFDSAMSLDLNTGRIKWSKRLQGFDAWTVACLSAPPGVNCPDPHSPDYDLGGSGPNLLRNVVGFGQKSGVYWGLNPDSGDIIWSSIVGPGGTLGGIEWGTATDGQRIYVAITNSSHKPYTLANGGPSINWGSWAALDPASGRILWQVADPTPGATDQGAVSVANGIVYAGSYSGTMYALDAAAGRVLFQFASGGSVVDGPSLTGNMVFWGSGYGHIAPGIPNNKVYAFSPSGGGGDH